ncbi:MAG: membrane protein insertase YidC [bacterium]
MDRRTILAFGLIFLVYIGWMKLSERMYGGSDQSAPADSVGIVEHMSDDTVSGEGSFSTSVRGLGAETVDQPTALVSEESASEVPIEAAFQFVDTEPTSSFVEIKTHLYKMLVSSRGAQIVSWRGLEFNGPDDTPVELVPQDNSGIRTSGDIIYFQGEALSLANVPFQVQGSTVIDLQGREETRSVVFQAETAGGLKVTKTFTIYPGRYDFFIDMSIQTTSGGNRDDIFAVTGEPRSMRFGWGQGIASTERNISMEEPDFRSFAMVGEDISFMKRRDLAKGPEKVQGVFRGSVKYAGLQNKYFTAIGIVPLQPDEVVEGAIGLDGNVEYNHQTWWIELPLRQQIGDIGKPYASRIQMFVGPCEFNIMRSYGLDLEKSLDLGWKLFRPLSELVLSFMTWLYKWIPNYGFIIVILSVLTKLMFYPLTRKSTESMRRMQSIQPKIKALQEKHKDDREKQSQEMMKLYKEEKVNPMAGCLPLLVQSPVFIALYQVLRRTIALRQAPFTMWMKDLAEPDALFQLPFTLPFLGNSFNLLPILMAVAMYFQTKLTPTPSTGGQMAMLNTMMPVMMLFIFYNMPSGLVLYWFINTAMTIYQTWRIQRTAPVTGGV